MNLWRRIEKLEGDASGLHSLGIIEARPRESARDAIARVAKERGLEFHKIGFAWVWLADGSDETYQTVHDPSVLIGQVSHESVLAELNHG